VRPARLGLIGDFDASVVAHRGINASLPLAARALGVDIEPRWIHTTELGNDPSLADRCDGIWCVPATPYANGAAVVAAIRHARRSGQPFLGTCGGYQHALLEYARNVLGLVDAAHEEEEPEAALLLIGRLSCEMVEATGSVRLTPGSRLAQMCGTTALVEGYHCRFGLDPRQRAQFDGGPLRIVAEDQAGEPRAFELNDHPFFIGTAFQPERAGLAGRAHPIVSAFLDAAVAHAKQPLEG
jgi:CTP synthase (UTP-ammonia lyase)